MLQSANHHNGCVIGYLQSMSSTESSFDVHRVGQYSQANGSFGMSGITDDSDDDDSPAGQ